MVKVFFETMVGGYCELVATFVNEETYIVCLPALEKMAEENRMFVTEDIEDMDEE